VGAESFPSHLSARTSASGVPIQSLFNADVTTDSVGEAKFLTPGEFRGLLSRSCRTMTDSAESTEWTTVSLPKEAAEDIQSVYEREGNETRYGREEPLWAFVLRSVSRLDDGEDE